MPQPDRLLLERLPRAGTGLTVQAILVVASFALVVAPPADGQMLIAPVLPTSTASTLRWAFADGALLVGPGPYPGSVIVTASRAALLPSAMAHGALLLTASLASCGTLRKTPV